MEQITEFISSATLIVGLVTTFVISVINARKEIMDTVSEVIGKQTDSNVLITKHLEDVKERVNADRVHIYEFHNGEYFANGRSSLKLSCTFETVRTGFYGIQLAMQKIPLSMFPSSMEQLIRNGSIVVTDMEDIKYKYPALHNIRMSMDVVSFYDVILLNTKGNPIGIMSVQFLRDGNRLDLEKESVIPYLIANKIIIESLLNGSLV